MVFGFNKNNGNTTKLEEHEKALSGDSKENLNGKVLLCSLAVVALKIVFMVAKSWIH